MKAAVLHQYGEAPKYGEFPAPVAQQPDQLLVTITAAAIKNLDKGKASGAHYSSGGRLAQPEVVGVDGVGTLADGTRIYAFGLTGMLAEQGLADKNRLVKLPANLDDVTAAALPNAIFGSAAALRFRANVQPGETVLINGATGVTGQLAVQLARHYGARHIMATGRNPELLQKLRAQGVETVSLQQSDEEVLAQLREMHVRTPIDVVIDYLWGRPAELILQVLQGRGGTTHRVRFVTVGGMADDTIRLSSGTLRSSDITLLGSGLGSVSEADMQRMFADEMPGLLQLAADGHLTIDTVTAPLHDIEAAWTRAVDSGTRLVIVM
ncbi:alcohol dehydrogenase [Hymenobacter psoromatis]|nr:alcohol dehydrogenase [Hymenobacter psoromatis]